MDAQPTKSDLRKSPGPRPHFVPDGWIALLDAFDSVGRYLFPDDWTYTEIEAPLPRVIAAAREAEGKGEVGPFLGFFSDSSEAKAALGRSRATFDNLRRRLQAGAVRAVIITQPGLQREIREYQWAAAGAAKMLFSGQAEVADEWNSVSGWVIVSRDDLERELGQTQEAVQAPKYLPPYLEFLVRATNQLGLSEDVRKPKADIEEWLRGNWPAELGPSSQAKISSMATFLRHPEDAKGGHFKATRKA